VASFHEPPKILVVNDEAPLRLLCRVNLESEGFDVEEAADGPSGLAMARDEKPDLILLDTMMPGLDGWRVAESLRGDPASDNIRFVFVAPRPPKGYQDYVRAFEIGANDYFTLPFNPLELAPRVRQVLERTSRGDRDDFVRKRLAELKYAPVESDASSTAAPNTGEAVKPGNHFFGRFLTSAAVVAVVLALIGGTIFLSVHPLSWHFNPEESVSVTNACLGAQHRFEHDRTSEEGLRNAGVLYPIALNARDKSNRVVVLFVDPSDVPRAGNDMKKVVRTWVLGRLRKNVIPGDELRRGVNRSVRTSDNAVIAYLGNEPDHIFATEKAHRVVDDCVTVVREPDAFSNWAGAFSSRTLDHPFSTQK
jgi:CheY-like chemotaxis protein